MKRNWIYMGCLLFLCQFSGFAQAQDVNILLQGIRAKLDKVNDYIATGEMKTNISFLKVPDAQVKVYFKKPGRLKIKNEKGISLVPKGSISISLNNLLSGKYQALDGGTDKLNGNPVRIIKLLPLDDNAEVVLSVLYVDEARLLVVKAKTTTRESGTNELEMEYSKYAAYALPDKVVFSFNAQEYKLPKGVTFDYDDGSRKKKTTGENKNQRGKIAITYSGYEINKGFTDEVFK
jgi:outer membrane lipoprotein-sorting protein